MSLELTPEVISAVEAYAAPAIEQRLGLTAGQVRDYYELSETENPDFSPTERRDDVVGKFEHGWRTGEIGPEKWDGAIDAAWPFLKPFVGDVVDKTITTAGKDI